jgi:ribonuclease HI
VAVLDESGAYVEGHAGTLGNATNNVAEYRALLEALELARERGADEVVLRADSELIVRQMDGSYRVRHPALIPLHEEAARRARAFRSFRLAHVERSRNKEADRLVNRALDRAAAAPGEAIRILDVPEPQAAG